MGLSRRLARRAVGRVSVLVVDTPGWDRVRCEVEAGLRSRGWRPASSPADADALVVCGRPAPRLQTALDATWDQLPGPRARVTVLATAEASSALLGVQAALLDDDQQRRDAAARSLEPAGGPSPDEDDNPSNDHGAGDMDQGGMDMPTPGGIPLAGGAEDRDGLEMDVLHVPLGPVLPAWPAGLLLHCTVSGDVVTEADAELLDAASAPPGAASLMPGSTAERLDRASRILALAGPEAAATEVAMLRDDVLAAPDPDVLRPRLRHVTGRLRRSRLLRWSLSSSDLRDPHDVYEALLAQLDEARTALRGAPVPVMPVRLEALADRVVGRQLAEVRLLVAATELKTAPSLTAEPA